MSERASEPSALAQWLMRPVTKGNVIGFTAAYYILRWLFA